ncbi:MAG: 50S ribosomal protein L3 [Candidatus Aenigmatarchaeota archaeon]|nr:50S ribosomal protein L3 [Candidatus Aenigmarchaeota archaeon]
MPNLRRPRRGSKGYWPRARASRIYPAITSWPVVADPKPLGFAGWKAGMSHAMMVDTNPNSRTKGQLVAKPVTVLECPPLVVWGYRIYTCNGARSVSALDVIFEKPSKNLGRKIPLPKAPKTAEQMKKLEQIKNISAVRLLCHTQPTFKKKPEIFELALGGTPDKQLEYAKSLLGKEIKISDVFKAGDFIDTIAVTKGKGFQGPVKRFGIKMFRRKAQQMQRHTGSLGQTEPGKVRPTVPQAGQLGFFTRTELNKRIVKIGSGTDINPVGDWLRYGKIRGDYIVIEGSVPGPTKRLIRLRLALRPPKVRHPVDIKAISTVSMQGV